jgi:hypothetical protein
MKKDPFILLLVLSLTVLTFFPLAAFSGEIDVVDAYFQSKDGEINTEVSVYAHAGKKNTSRKAFIRISQTDSEDRPVLEASGSAMLAGNTLQVDDSLDLARLKESFKVSDTISRKTFNVDLDLSWTSAGDPIQTQTDFYFESPGVVKRMKERADSTRRVAECVGNVSIAGRNLTPEPTRDAQISSLWVTKKEKK